MPISNVTTRLAALPVLLAFASAAAGARTDEDAPHDIEIGTGGTIKLEAPYRTDLEAQFEWHAHALWESRYITEGRDNLSGAGMLSASTEFIIGDLSILPWIADSPAADYTELNLHFVYGMKPLDDLEVFAGFNLLRADEAGVTGSDSEINIDVAYAFTGLFRIMASAYYSFDAEGLFTELAVEKDHDIDEALSASVRAALGFNGDYVIDGHNGLNYGSLRAHLSYRLMKTLSAYAYLSYSMEFDRDVQRYPGDALLRDLSWGGVGLTYRF